MIKSIYYIKGGGNTSVHITKDKKIKMNKILGGKGMKIGIIK